MIGEKTDFIIFFTRVTLSLLNFEKIHKFFSDQKEGKSESFAQLKTSEALIIRRIFAEDIQVILNLQILVKSKRQSNILKHYF